MSRPPRGIIISDEGHLEVRKGSEVRLTCQFAVEQVWSSINGLHTGATVENPTEYYGEGGRKIFSNMLMIVDAEEHHSDTYFCSGSRSSIPTAIFTIKIT